MYSSSLEEPFSALSSSTPSAQAPIRRAPQWKWNPYTDTPLPSLLTSGLLPQEAMSIPDLVEMYEQQVTALVNSHEDIMFVKGKVQDAINKLRFTPKESTNYSGSQRDEKEFFLAAEQSRELELLKQGLDIRLRQFAEDCQSASKLEWVLRRKLSTTEDSFEKSMQKVNPSQVQPTCEALKKIQDQDRLIKLLQHVLDQNLYHNYVFAERLRQMRKECFADELQCWRAIHGDTAWFEGEEIRFEAKDSTRFVSSWMQLIRTHPTPETVSPPPRADPHSLSFVSKMNEIDQLATAVAKGGHKVTKFSRQRDLKELQGQLSQLRKVLTGAAAAARGIEKVILKDLTTQVGERISDTSEAKVATDGSKLAIEQMTKAVALDKVGDGARTRMASRAQGWTLAESKDKHEPPTAAGRGRVDSRSPLRQGTIVIPMSNGHAFSKIPPTTLPSPRGSLTSVVDVEEEEAKPIVEPPEKDVLGKRKDSFSRPLASPPRLVRGASRTVRSPRQSFEEEMRRSHSGVGETAQKLTEDFLPSVRSDTGVTQSRGKDREEARVKNASSAQLNATVSRAGSRTVPSPQRSLSRGSLTLRSPRKYQAPTISTPLSRAMSSAFLGG